ncbi:hypothetical protein Droror1_Dr00008935 [Drosera rotundifolia]
MSQPESNPNPNPKPDPDPNPDYAPDSFLLSKSAELDWIDQNAYIERKDSAKSHNNNVTNTTTSSSSQRFAVNFTLSRPTSIISGIPTKKPSHHQRQCSVRGRNLWSIPKRSSGKSSAAVVSEPGSPKVSCMGRVRSKRAGKKMKEKKKKKRNGFWGCVRGLLFRSGRGTEPEEKKEGEEVKEAKEKEKAVEAEKAALVAPRLGAVQRYSSGRRSGALAGDLETDGSKRPPVLRSQ